MHDENLLTRREALKLAAVTAGASLFPRKSWAGVTEPTGLGKFYAIGGAMSPPRYGKPLPADPQQAIEQCDPHGFLRRICKDGDLGAHKMLLVTCAASNDIPEGKTETLKQSYTREYLEEFELAGARDIVAVSNTAEVFGDAALKAIRDPNTSTIMLGGGDQERLVAELRYGLSKEDFHRTVAEGKELIETEFYKLLMKRVRAGNIMVAGTSAGASAMSKQMLQDVRCGLPGLDMLDCVIDTHADREKWNSDNTELLIPPRKADRIIQALQHPQNCCPYAFSLEESAGIIIDGKENTVELFGKDDKGVHFMEEGKETCFIKRDKPVEITLHKLKAKASSVFLAP